MSSTATVSKVQGQVFAIRDGQEIQLSIGTELLVSDAVRTGLESGCELNFADGTQVQLGSLTQVRIEDFAYDPAGSVEPSFALHMMEGLVNTVTGEVVKLNPEAFSLSTPLGTAGIRGTTVLTRIFPTHVVFMVTDMAEGHSVHINNIFGNSLTIFQPGQGVELSLDGHNELKSFDFLPQDLKDLILNFMTEDSSSSESHPFFFYGDADFMAAVGVTALEGGVGMLSEQAEEIIIALLDELGVEQPEFFLEGPPEGPKYPMAGSFFGLSGDPDPNWLVPGQDSYGPYFKDMNYEISGKAGDDTIVVYNGQDTVYGGQGSFDQIFKITDNMTDGVMLHGGEDSLTGVATLDNDVIVIRALGASTDDEAGWISTNTAEYGATVMSGGAVYGSAQTLTNSSGGANEISVYGTMDGGAIYGNAQTADNSSLGSAAISINQGLGADGQLTGGDMTGGVIYGDAQYLNGGSGGANKISVYGTMSGGVIYGNADTATDSSLGNASITLNQGLDENGNLVGGDMTDGVIYGDAATMNGGMAGNDYISLHSMSGGTIYGDAASGTYTAVGNRIYVTGVMEGGTIHAGDGKDYVEIAAMSGGLLDLGLGEDQIKVAGAMSGGAIYGDGQSLSGGAAAKDIITVDSLSDKAVIYGDAESGNYTAGNNEITVSKTMSGGSIYAGNGNDIVKIATMSGGLLDLGAGDDNVTVSLYEGGTINMGGDSGDVLTIADHESGATLFLGETGGTVNITSTDAINFDIGAISAATIINATEIGTLHIGTLSDSIKLTNAASTPEVLSIDTLNLSSDVTINTGIKFSLLEIGDHSGAGQLSMYHIHEVNYKSGAGSSKIWLSNIGGYNAAMGGLPKSYFTLSGGNDLVTLYTVDAGTYNISALDGSHQVKVADCVATGTGYEIFNLNAEKGAKLTFLEATVSGSPDSPILYIDGAGEIVAECSRTYESFGSISIKGTGSVRIKEEALAGSISIAQTDGGTTSLDLGIVQHHNITDEDSSGRGLFTLTADRTVWTPMTLTEGQNSISATAYVQHKFNLTLGDYNDTVNVNLGKGSYSGKIILGGGEDRLKINAVGQNSSTPNSNTISLGNDSVADNVEDIIDLSATYYESNSDNNVILTIKGVTANVDTVLLGAKWTLGAINNNAYTLIHASNSTYKLTLSADAALSFDASVDLKDSVTDNALTVDLGAGIRTGAIKLGSGADNIKVVAVGQHSDLPATKHVIDLGSDDKVDIIDLSNANYQTGNGDSVTWTINGVSGGDKVLLGDTKWTGWTDNSSGDTYTYTLTHTTDGGKLILDASAALVIESGIIP
ncbi:FecR domain-containing protein [Desulfovibrio sp. OttesenSCG-928-M14]|nr:FecR domain-containing protein [Desulfovibrio sp. OttesenSCG-928-M14]